MFKKVSWFLVSLFLISFIFTACGTKDLTKGKTAEEILKDVYTKMAEVKNYDMNIKMNMNVEPPEQEPVNINLQGQATVFQKPMVMKMSMIMDVKGKKKNFQQYMEQNEGGMTIYQKIDDQWSKMALNDPAFSEMMNMDPSQNVKLYLENLKRAEILSDEKVGEKEIVKLEMILSSKIYDEMLQQMPGGNLTGQLPFNSDILSKIGDIKGKIWVDKATLDIVKVTVDMTENMQNFGKALAENGGLPEEAAAMFSNMEISVEYEMLNQNKAVEFTIPEEAKNAPEMPMAQ